MATYANNLRLTEITTGDESGTWGTTTNNNWEFTTAALGYGVKNMAADADQTFTMTDGTADTLRSMYLKITSTITPLTATRTLTIAPTTVSKVWIIENATTGSQSIIIKQGSGATVTIATGTKAMVYTDGLGSGAAVISASPTLSNLSGTLPIASGGTNGTASPTANGVAYGTGSTYAFTAAGTTGQIMTATTSGAPTWQAPAAGGVSYVVKTTTYTMADKEGVLANTSGGAFTVTLPSTPATGTQCIIADSNGTFGTYNLTAGRNGSTIAGVAQDLVLDINGVSVQFVYNGSTWDVYAQVGGNGSTVLSIAQGGTGASTAAGANAALQAFTTTATAGATTTLTNTSTYYQYFTGITTQTVVMPVTSTLSTGWSFHIANNSTGNITVNSSGANLIGTIIPGTTIHITCIDTTVTTAAGWDYGFTDFGTITGTGANVLGTSPTLTTPTVTGYIETVTAGGTVTSTKTIVISTGTVYTATLTASTACTFTMPTATAGTSFIMLLKQAASTGNGTATFTSVKWGTAGAPTITATAGKMDILTFVCDGTNWYGSIAQGYTP